MRGWWRRPTLSKAEAQRLLDGGSGDSAVADLLRAASGPARPGELAGERAAVAAFRLEYAAAATAGARPAPPRPARRAGRRVAVLAAALTAAALAGTGVAAAAGRLPAPLQRVAHDWIDQVPEPGPGPRPEPTVHAGSPTPPPVHRPSVTPAPTQAGTPAVDVKKLCREWEKARDDPNRKPMDPADLRALTAAAGGADRIEAFCGLAPSGPAPGHQQGPPSSTKSKKAGRR
jgi:hypothetical protein